MPLAPAADFTAYRVIQESLTNVYKHSGTHHARLTLAYERHELRITVDGPGASLLADARDPAPGRASSGQHGILGMGERVHALGGRFKTGLGPDGTFRVVTALPYQPRDPVPEAKP